MKIVTGLLSANLLVVGGWAYVDARGKSIQQPMCQVTDNNPCSAFSGPFGWGDYRVAPKGTLDGYKRQEMAPKPPAALKSLHPFIGAKVVDLQKHCGARLVSGYRPGARVAGSGRPSNHSRYPSWAADLQGNPSCMYARLKGWKGGYSTDYYRVNHVHIGMGREMGARFVHGGGGTRYAKKRRHMAPTQVAAYTDR